ncbi:GNAT family N-acetyltransferase [Demequina sp. NBRC 110057]|uniref:GNAT family N-acetyltransferase n=1 Tax=Demequina sp. NBRC 110057 TaxID=1570346 RepID=UPI0009FC26EE|nr:GNAT family protein [Demequina sp. NBRC 110057]
MAFSDSPVLENSHTRLEPLSLAHRDGLARAVAVDDLWRTWVTTVPSPDEMEAEIARRIARQRSGEIASWAVIDRATDAPVGMTTYLHLTAQHRRLEIGSTWLGREAQGTGINTAAKLLLLTRAFEDLGCHAVEFRTHWHNHQSRAAIARLGAKQDGVLRSHMVWKDGTLRDTVVFSIIATEWPTVRASLTARLDGGR